MITKEELQKAVDFLETEFDLDSIELPDEYYYTCLPLCLLDAVFSIGVTYLSTRNAVQRYCDEYNIPCYDRENRGLNNPHTISNLIYNIETIGVDDFARNVVRNKQRTSSKNGILKAEAVLECARVFQKNGIEDLNDFRSKMNAAVAREYLEVKGQASGISLKYLNMLCGDEEMLKPDRHIIRFLNAYCHGPINIENAELIMKAILDSLIEKYPTLTMRKLDFIIWQYQSNS